MKAFDKYRILQILPVDPELGLKVFFHYGKKNEKVEAESVRALALVEYCDDGLLTTNVRPVIQSTYEACVLDIAGEMDRNEERWLLGMLDVHQLKEKSAEDWFKEQIQANIRLFEKEAERQKLN